MAKTRERLSARDRDKESRNGVAEGGECGGVSSENLEPSRRRRASLALLARQRTGWPSLTREVFMCVSVVSSLQLFWVGNPVVRVLW